MRVFVHVRVRVFVRVFVHVRVRVFVRVFVRVRVLVTDLGDAQNAQSILVTDAQFHVLSDAYSTHTHTHRVAWLPFCGLPATVNSLW